MPMALSITSCPEKYCLCFCVVHEQCVIVEWSFRGRVSEPVSLRGVVGVLTMQGDNRAPLHEKASRKSQSTCLWLARNEGIDHYSRPYVTHYSSFHFLFHSFQTLNPKPYKIPLL